MTQIERIRYMEQILDEANAAIQALSDAMARYRAVESGIAELEAYYTGGQWRQDYDDDCAGRIPRDLKRGVLSEDAVYDLLHRQREWKEAWEELIREPMRCAETQRY